MVNIFLSLSLSIQNTDPSPLFVALKYKLIEEIRILDLKFWKQTTENLFFDKSEPISFPRIILFHIFLLSATFEIINLSFIFIYIHTSSDYTVIIF